MPIVLPKEDVVENPTQPIRIKLPKAQTPTDEFSTSKFGEETVGTEYDYGALPQMDKEALRGERQGAASEIANAIGGGLAKIPFTVIGNAASILDFEDYANTDKEVGNSITAAAEEIKGNIEGATKIYKSNDNTLSSREWWLNNGKGLIDSAGGFVLTGGALGKGVQLLSNLTKGSKVVQALGTTANAIMLNQAESVPIAMSVYKNAYDTEFNKLKPLVDSGELTAEQADIKAQEGAADAASYSIAINRVNIPLNLTSAYAFLRAPALTRQVAKDYSRKEVVGKMLAEGTQEYVEENVNMIAEKEALRKAQEGKDYSLDFGRVIGDVLSKEGFETGLIGFLGGAVQTGGTEVLNALTKDAPSYDEAGNVRKDETGNPILVSRPQSQKERFQAQQTSLNRVEALGKTEGLPTIKETLNKVKVTSDLVNDIQIASINNETEKVEELKNQLLVNQSLDAFKNGTTEQLIEMYRSIAKDPASKEKLGADYSRKASEAVKQIEDLEKIYTKFQNAPQLDEVFNNRAEFYYKLKRSEELRRDQSLAYLEQQREINATGFNTPEKIKELTTTQELEEITNKISEVTKEILTKNKEYNTITSPEYAEKIVKEKQQKIAEEAKAKEQEVAAQKVEAEQALEEKTPDNFKAQVDAIEDRRGEEMMKVPADDKAKQAEVNARYDAEIAELEKEYKPRDIVSEEPQVINTQVVTIENPKTRNARTPFKTESGLDDDTKSARNRYFRYIEKNKIADNKLLVVTKTNNLKLYNELLELDKEAKAYEEQYKKDNKGAEYQGIYTVLVDKANKPVKANEKGESDKEGSIVFSTLTTPERIEEGSITVADKKAAIKELNEFRTALLDSKEDIYLNITDKSKGHAVFEPTKEGVRQSHSVVGRLDTSLDEISLELPTLAIEGQKDRTILKNGQVGYTGRLYGFNKNSGAIDLIPRTLNASEVDLMVDLILQRMGVIENQAGDVSKEIEKLIYFGIPKKGANETTIGVAKGTEILTLGTTSLTKDQLSTPEGQSTLKSFLNTKRVNINKIYGFDDSFVDAAGKRHNSYKEYLLSGKEPMFGTDLVTLDKAQFRNQYLTYDPTLKVSEVKSTPVETAKPVQTDKEKLQALIDSMMEDSKGDTIFPGELDRLKSTKDVAPPLTQEETNWFKTTFPNIPIEPVKGLIDNKSLGRFLSAGKVLLSSEATVGTLYHEAFHTTTQLYLTQEEIDRLYKETKERLNLSENEEFKKLSKREQRKFIEEALAEDFANYKATKNILGKAPERNSIFKRLYNFIRDLLALPASSIEDIYRRLDKGYYTGKPIVGIREFTRLDKALPNQSEANTKDILDGIDAYFSDILFHNNLTPSAALQESQKVNGAILKRVFKKIATDEKVPVKTRIYILENTPKVVEAWVNRAKATGIEVKLEEDFDPNVELSVNEEENITHRSGEAHTEANLVSAKTNMSNQSKMLIRTLKQKNANGTDKLNDLGLPAVVDFGKTYNFILKNTVGLLTYSEIYNKINELSNSKPELKDLLKRLGEPSSAINTEQFLFQMQFRQDFSKNQSTSFKTVLKADGAVYIVDANKENTSGRIKEDWKNNIKNNATQNEEGRQFIDPTIAEKGTSIEFLESLGWMLSTETKTYIKEEQPAWFNNSVTAIRNYIITNKGDVTDIFESKEKTKQATDETSNIEKLANLEADFNPTVTELSFFSTEGKTVYSIGMNNALSIIKNIINTSKTKQELFARLPHLDTVSTEGSLWLEQLFDDKGNKRKEREIKLDLHDGLKSDTTVKGRDASNSSTRKLSAGDKYVQEITSLLLDGRSSYIRASDKSTEHTLSLNKYGKSQKLAIPIEDFKKGFDVAEVKRIFNNYFKAEVKRVALYRIKDLGKDLDVYNKAGNHFTIFEGILSTDTKASLNKVIDTLHSQQLSQEELTESLDNMIPAFYGEMNKDLLAFFERYSVEITNALKENNISIGQGLSSEDFKAYTIEQLSRAVAVNGLINSIEQIKLFVGDMAYYKDLFKRTAGFTGTKETADNSTETNEWLNNNNKRVDKKVENGTITVAVFEDVNQTLNEEYLDEYIQSLVDSGVTEEQARTILTAYTSMDEGDAQGWITLDELRSFEIRMGHWTPAKEKLFDKVQKGETLSAEELVLFTVKKAQYSGPQQYNGLYAPAYHKYSLLPLLPQLVKGKNLEKILTQMTKNEIGYALFKSGSKVGTRVDKKGKANDFYTDTISGDINTGEWQKQVVYYDFLGLQTATPEPKPKVIFGTQFRKLLFSNMFEGGKEAFSGNKKLLEGYNQVIDDLVQAEKTKLIKELGVNPESYTSEDVSKIVDLLQREARERNLADNLIDGIQSELVDGKLMLKYKFDAMVTKVKIDSMLISIVQSRLIRQKVNGDALIQVASSGFEEKGKREVGTNDALLFYRKGEDGKTLPAEAMIAINDNYRPLLELYKDAKDPLKALNEAIREGKIEKELLEFVAYRIPTQGLNSMEYFTIKEFLPEESSTAIVLPTAIVAKSGGDYDVDKLNVIRPNIKEGKYSKDKQNRIIEIAKEILSHENNFAALITPNSNKILTSVVDEIRYLEYLNKPTKTGKEKLSAEDYKKEYDRNLKNIKYTDQLKLTTQIEQFVKFLTAKNMIGIAAVQNTHHILAQQNNLTINKTYTKDEVKEEVRINLDHNLTEDGKIDISKIKDVSSINQISEVISQILTSAVDAAKDPFVFALNMTKETLSTYLYLIRTGVPFENIAYFMKQPIITEYLKAQSINNSGFLKAVKQSQSKNELKNRVKYKYRQAYKGQEKDIKDRTLSTDELKSYLKESNQHTQEFYETQLQVLNDYLRYKDEANLLSEAIKATNMDTSGLGKNIDSIERKIKSIDKVKATGFVNGIDSILENSLVKSFNQLEFAQKAFSQFYYTQNPEFKLVKSRIFEAIGPFGDSEANKLSTLIENDLISFVIENWGYPNAQELRNRLFDTQSVAKRLLNFKNKKNKNHDEIKLAKNMLINELYPLIRTATRKIDNLKIYAKRYDSFTANQLTESFKELKDLNPEFAKDIMDLGILQSGLNNSPITYLGIIPYEYYNELVKEAFEKFNKDADKITKLASFEELFLANNSNDNIVARAEYIGPRRGDGIYGKDYALNQVPQVIVKKPIVKQVEVEDIEYIPEDIDDASMFPEDEPQFSKRNTPLEQKLIDSKFITKHEGVLWAKKHFLAEARRFVNAINRELGSAVVELKKINRVGEGGRDIWRVIVNPQLEAQFTTTQAVEEPITQEVANKLLDDFSKRMGVDAEVTTKEALKKLFGDKYNGEEAMFYKDKVFLTKLDLDDLVHEFVHPFVDGLVRDNYMLFENILEQVSKENPEIVEEVEKLYGEDSAIIQLKEIATRGLTKLAKQNIDKTTGEAKSSALQRLWTAIKDLIQRILGVDTVAIKDLSPNSTLQELADLVSTHQGTINLGKTDLLEQEQFKKEENTEEAIKEEPVEKNELTKLVGNVKLFLEKKLAILKNQVVKDKSLKENQIKRLLGNIKALDEVESINTFIEDSYNKITLAEAQFDSLIKNKDNFNRHEMIDKLSSFNDFANGYNILDEISKVDIEEFFANPIKGLKEEASFTPLDKLTYSIAARERIKQRYLRQGIPLLADYLLEQKSSTIDKSVQKEIDQLKERIKLIEGGKLGEDKKSQRILDIQYRIEKLSSFSLDKASLVDQLRTASKDEGAIDFLFSPLISSDDSVLALFAKSVKNELETARLQDIEFAKEADKAYTDYAKTANNPNNVAKFNEGIYEEIEVPVGKTEEGETVYSKKKAFVQKYDVTKYEKAKNAFFKSIGPKPVITEYSTPEERKALKEWNKSIAEWFKNNTQPKSQAEIDEIMAQKKSELDRRIITQEEYEEWLGSVVSSYNDEVTYKRELTEPAKQHINPNYTKLYSEDGVPSSEKGKYHQFLVNSYKEAQKKLPENFQRGYVLPSISKQEVERMQTKGIIDTIKTKAREAVKIQSYDTEYGIAGLTEEGVKFLPVFYTQQMNSDDVSLDLISSIMRYSSMANKYEALNNISGEIALTKAVVGERQTVETTSTGKKMIDAFAKKMGYEEYIKKHGEAYSKKHLDAFIDMVVYGEMQKAEELFGIDAGKLTNTLLNYSAITTLAVDLLKATANNIQGNIQARIEASSKDFFDKKSLLKGKAYYTKSIPSFLSDFGSISPKELPSKLTDLYDPIQGSFKDNYGREVSGTNLKKLFSTDTLFFNQHAAEHEIQVSTLFAVLEFNKVTDKKNGAEISLLDAYKQYGTEGIYENTDFTETKRREVQNQLHAVNKRLHGVYNDFDKGTAQRYSLGRLAIMYRKYLIPAYKRRFKEVSSDQEAGLITEGYYRTFWNTFAKDLKDLKFNVMQNWSTYTDFEKAQIRKTLTEASFILALTVLVAGLKGMGDDDKELKKNYAYNFMLYQAIRMRSETASYISPRDAYKALRSPSAMTTTADRAIKLTNQLLPWNINERYERKSGMWAKGDSKAWAAFLKLAGISGYNFSPEAATEAFEGTLNK